MSKLVIVESNAKAKTINKYLGKEYKVRASMGHVRDLPKSKIGVDIERDFAPDYVVIADRKKILTELKKLAKAADEVFLASDLDREGEAIAWHLAEVLKLPKEKTRRVVFNEITKDAIREAFLHPSTVNENKVNAQQARRILDRVVGYQLSPLLWKKVRRGLSAGRVQSVVVRLIVEREREIEKFKPVEYWEIEAQLAPFHPPAEGPGEFRAKLTKLDGNPLVIQSPGEERETFVITTEAQARQIAEELRAAKFSVTRFDTKERALPAPPPFNTSTLQQQASIQLHFTAKKTMFLAQRLYEGVELGAEGSVGLITYMRTDSLHVADQALAACREFISSAFPDGYLPDKPAVYKSGKGAQGAHEAVRPTSPAYTPEKVKPFLEPALFRLYDLIWRRFVASQMKPGRLAVADVEIAAGRATFEAQGRRLLFDGHLRLTGFDSKSETQLPPLAAKDPLKLLALDPSQHFTKPPPRYSEASLVKTLEKLGIGRPSTYAPIISTIQARDYVRKDKGRFWATELGKLVTDKLVAHFGDIMDVKFTSHMEDRLDEVEEAKADWVGTLKEFYGPFSADLKKAEETMQKPEPAVTEYKCELCGKPMLKRWSPRGEFLGCSGYPECRSTRPLDAEGKPAAKPAVEATDEKCEKCGSPMVIRTGRNGRFMACSAYPKCKNTRNIAGPNGGSKPAAEPTNEKCDKCGSPMVIRTGRRGRFMACSAYPKCRNTRNVAESAETGAAPAAAKPAAQKTDEKCDKCGKPMAVRYSKRGPFLGCTGYPECKNAKPLPKG
jgi:DNA topoisomerase-1